MPIYEYQCDECGQVFEKMKKRTDPEPPECEACGAADPRRVISQTAFQLKGEGWYVTDYKPSKKKKAAPEAEASTTSTPSTATDSAAPAGDTSSSSSTASVTNDGGGSSSGGSSAAA